MKDGKTEDGGWSVARKWVRKSPDCLCRNIYGDVFFGGRIAVHTDLNTIGELRRIGGLLKHNFETLRQAKAPQDVFERQEEALRKLAWVIQKISLLCHYDCQENQEYEG